MSFAEPKVAVLAPAPLTFIISLYGRTVQDVPWQRPQAVWGTFSLGLSHLTASLNLTARLQARSSRFMME